MEHVKSPLTHRQRQALATQALILDAARALFLRQGYVATTIDAIAAEAGVGVSTVYAIFRNKRGILAAIREAWHLESGQREIYQRARREPDPKARLALAAHATRRQWETSGEMVRIYDAAANADPDAAAELAKALQGRRANLRGFIEEMSPGLRAGVTPAEAVAIFFALTHSELYHSLVGDDGWSPDSYERWLAATLQAQLLG
jgi:AcrR family transcriptional regulator